MLGEREGVGQSYLIILRTKTVKCYILTLFEMIFWVCRDNFENKVACSLALFESICNFRGKLSLKHAFDVFKTIWTCTETFENNVSKASRLAVFETIWNCRETFENNVSKAGRLTVFETIWNCTETFENNVSKACILTLTNY